MGFLGRLVTGWRLGKRSLFVVARDKTLMAFPLISVGLAAFTVLMFYLSVGPDKYQFIFNTMRDERGVQSLNYGYYAAAAIAYLLLAFTTNFMNAALVGCAEISMAGGDSRFRDGVRASLRHVFSLALWSLLTATVGVLLGLLDLQRHASHFLRRRMGAAWPIFTYFVTPTMVLENTHLFAAMRRSPQIMAEKWGEAVKARFGALSFVVLLNAPLAAAALYFYFSDATANALWAALGLMYLALTLVLALTAKSVLTVVLYKYAVTGEAPAGFPESLLRNAFGASGAPPEPEVGDGT